MDSQHPPRSATSPNSEPQITNRIGHATFLELPRLIFLRSIFLPNQDFCFALTMPKKTGYQLVSFSDSPRILGIAACTATLLLGIPPIDSHITQTDDSDIGFNHCIRNIETQ
jgi:hypothetical protein